MEEDRGNSPLIFFSKNYQIWGWNPPPILEKFRSELNYWTLMSSLSELCNSICLKIAPSCHRRDAAAVSIVLNFVEDN